MTIDRATTTMASAIATLGLLVFLAAMISTLAGGSTFDAAVLAAKGLMLIGAGLGLGCLGVITRHVTLNGFGGGPSDTGGSRRDEEPLLLDRPLAAGVGE